MDLKTIFLEAASPNVKKEIQKQIKKHFEGDKKYFTLKKKAVKNSDAVPEFLDYIYFGFSDQLEKMSKKYKIDFDELAQIAIAA